MTSLLRVLKGETMSPPPVWFMRQAGRYLPEYKALREKAGDFVRFCLTPDMACEATLQPIRRFGMDAAILFSDILMLPLGLGQEVRFEAGEGPVLGPLPPVAALRDAVDEVCLRLEPVAEAVKLCRAALGPEMALIGFCGGPWTVMTYMLNGRKAHDRTLIRSFVYEQPELVQGVLETVIEASALYLRMQAQAGAQALQIFESWAEGFPDPLFEQLVVDPHQKLIARVRELGVDLPIIGFPRGAEARTLDYARRVEVQAVGMGTATPLALGSEIQRLRAIQGALDPVALRSGGPALDAQIDGILEAWGTGPLVFNLGHGIFPDTPISHVEQALKRIRG